MDKETRNAIERATQKARRLLEEDFAEQLDGVFDVRADGRIASKGGAHLTGRQHLLRDKIVAAVEHKRSAGMKPEEAVADYVRDAAFTALNRFAALKMLEARELVQECVSRGDASSGFSEFCGLAPALKTADGAGYRLYIESIFDELSTEVKVLFDRRDPASVLWPTKLAFDDLLAILNHSDLTGIWSEDETIGWVYQFFNSDEERREMREKSQTPCNSRELAIRNQFFTPSYVVKFLCDNTLGKLWTEMREGHTRISSVCDYLISTLSQGQTRRATKKDPRDIQIIDPACGSGHFLLYCFMILLMIYEEAWSDERSPQSRVTGNTLRADYPDVAALRKAVPALILQCNLYGIDIDPRCAQIAQLALWMRAQRAYKDVGVARSERPLIRRSNIVVAEPMPGDRKLVAQFVATVRPPVLGELFITIVDEMKFAGELGALLPLEQTLANSITRAQQQFEKYQQVISTHLPGLAPEKHQFDFDLSGISGVEFFGHAEGRLLDGLFRFVTEAANGIGTRRRLFADDAAQGLALVEMLRRKFDVVLMNPPFGEPVESDWISSAYSTVPKNLYAWFVKRASQLLTEDGLCGCITDSTFLKQPTFESLRETILNRSPLRLICDLGWGVLDANVRTAAYVFGTKGEDGFLFGSALDELTRATSIGMPTNYYSRSLSATMQLPKKLLSIEFGPDEADAIKSLETVDDVADLPWGCGANDSFRLFRLKWEIGPVDSTQWAPMTNGGSFSPFYRENYLICRIAYPGGSAFEVADEAGEKLWDAYAKQFIGRAGLTYPKRSELLHASALAAGHVVTPEGKGFFPNEMSLPLANGLMNCSFVGLLASYICGPHKQRGDVALLSTPDLDSVDAHVVETESMAAADVVARFYSSSETSNLFVAPKAAMVSASDGMAGVDEVRARVSRSIEIIDHVVAKGIPSGLEIAASEYRQLLNDRIATAWTNDVGQTEQLLSYALGVAFGRFDGRLATGERSAPPVPDPFVRALFVSPAMMTDGVELGSSAKAILVDDPGHTDDLGGAIGIVLGTLKADLGAELELAALRKWFAEEFFSIHLKTYSKGRRKAPIYWQLATRSKTYSVWIYLNGFNADTLYRVENEYVAPKLGHEKRQLDSMRSDPTFKTDGGRKALENQERFVEEIGALLDEIRIVVPLWNPKLSDGVIINSSPLWRLFSHHKTWQKELRTIWNETAAGKHDWADLAMRLWPDRVVLRCASDRSLAMEHDLLDVFWVVDAGEKWKQRSVSQGILSDLIRKRTSSAIKNAVKILEELPDQVSQGRPRRRQAK
jgi:23S rRNA G2445 N2-methylase RlmL